MGLWDWLRQKLTGRPPQRDISRLRSGDGKDAVRESVDTGGGPLKPGHQRRALRDPRLFPKARAPFGKRPKVMSVEEGRRLFGQSMRTQNRNLRDLLCDEEQLRRLDLPVWRNEEDLARALGLTLKQLWWWAMHREKETTPHYVTFAIAKQSGGERLIMAPKKRLKQLQRRLHQILISRLPLSPQAHGFVKGRSIVSGAQPHVGKKVVVRLDLQDFFPSVTWPRVRGYFIACGYSFVVASALAMLTTECQRQPVEIDGTLYHVPVGPRHCVQGAPTSPGLCNAIVLRLDRRLTGLAKRFGCDYTRYADDMCFSGDIDHDSAHGLVQRASQIIASEGFQVNPKKTKIMGRGRRQSVTGVVVNQVAGLSRQQRRIWRATLHRDKLDRAEWQGKLAFLWMLNPQQAAALWPTQWARPHSSAQLP